MTIDMFFLAGIGFIAMVPMLWVIGGWIGKFIEYRQRIDHHKTGRTIDRMRK